jgi:hypothetical protein
MNVTMAEVVTLAKINETESVDCSWVTLRLMAPFAQGDQPSILNANIRRTTSHAADETKSLAQGTSAWAGLGA